MTSVVCFLAAAAAALLLWPLLAGVFRSEVLQRDNYRGHRLPVATGLVVVLATLVVAAVQVLFLRLEVVDGPAQEVAVRSLRQACLLAFGLGLLGFVDDVAGDATSRGFRGHLRELGRGRLTTGGLKLIGTPVVAIMALNGFGVDNGGDLLLGAVIVALAANVGNLFDRAPGRTIKVTTLAAVVIALARDTRRGLRRTGGDRRCRAGNAAARSPRVGDARRHRRQRARRGDRVHAGDGAGPWERLVVLVCLVALNAAAEVVSFSKVIDRTPPLRWFDRLGRA